MPPVGRSKRLPWRAYFDCRRRSNYPVSVTASLIAAGGIKSRQVLASRSGRLLRLRPSDRLVTRHLLLRWSDVLPSSAKPPIRQIDLHLNARPPLRADRKHVAHDQHPDHRHWVDRGAPRVRVVSRKLPVHPIQIKNAIDLPDQMIAGHHLVEIKRIKNWPCPPSRHPS